MKGRMSSNGHGDLRYRMPTSIGFHDTGNAARPSPLRYDEAENADRCEPKGLIVARAAVEWSA